VCDSRTRAVYWWLGRSRRPEGAERTREVSSPSLNSGDRTRARSCMPHERTHAGKKEGRVRMLRATRTHLEHILLWGRVARIDGIGEPSSSTTRAASVTALGLDASRHCTHRGAEGAQLLIASRPHGKSPRSTVPRGGRTEHRVDHGVIVPGPTEGLTTSRRPRRSVGRRGQRPSVASR